MSTVDSLNDARAKLIAELNAAKSKVAECEAAITGLEVAVRLLAHHKDLGKGQSRSGERSVPDALKTAVLDYFKTISKQFNIRELRKWLAEDPNNFPESQTGDVLATLLRQLADEKRIMVAVKGVGRRLAEYEPGIHEPRY